jgi:polyhydroxybutyrate depolymerase
MRCVEGVSVMRMSGLAVVVVCLWSAVPAHAQTAPAGGAASCDLPHAAGVSSQQLVSGNVPRTYRLFVPPGYDGHARLPVVLDLHGSGGNAAGQAATSGFEGVAATERFIVATLDADGARWNVPVQPDRADDVRYVDDVLTHLGARVCADSARVYATGFSGGGRMTSLLACRLGARLAAVAPVAGLRFPGPCNGRAIPVLTFHGLADTQNPYDGHVPNRNEWVESVPDALASWARHNACTGDAVLDDPPGPLSTMRYTCPAVAEVRLIRIDGLGHTWTRREVDTTAAIWQFFNGHRLGR